MLPRNGCCLLLALISITVAYADESTTPAEYYPSLEYYQPKNYYPPPPQYYPPPPFKPPYQQPYPEKPPYQPYPSKPNSKPNSPFGPYQLGLFSPELPIITKFCSSPQNYEETMCSEICRAVNRMFTKFTFPPCAPICSTRTYMFEDYCNPTICRNDPRTCANGPTPTTEPQLAPPANCETTPNDPVIRKDCQEYCIFYINQPDKPEFCNVALQAVGTRNLSSSDKRCANADYDEDECEE